MRRKPIKKYLYSIFSLCFLSLVSALAFLGLHGMFYLYLFILGIFLGYYVLLDTKYHKIFYIFLSSLFWSSGLLILLAGLLALFSVKLGSYLIFLPFLFLIPLSIFRPITFSKKFFSFDKWAYFLIFLSLLSVLARVFSVRNYLAPILHDPLAHAEWAQRIYLTGQIDYFYSPGLHVLASLGRMLDSLPVSKYILILTNLFNALSFVPVFLFVKNHFKKDWFAILAALFWVLGAYPTTYFWTAGKNALVLALPFLFLLFFISSLYISRSKKLIITNFLTFILILIHYPTGAIALVGIFFLLLDKEGFKGLLNIFIGSLLGIIWGLLKLSYEVSRVDTNLPLNISNSPSLNLENMKFFSKTSILIFSLILHQYQVSFYWF